MTRRRGIALAVAVTMVVCCSCSLGSSKDDKSAQAATTTVPTTSVKATPVTVPTTGAEAGFCTLAVETLEGMSKDKVTFVDVLQEYTSGSKPRLWGTMLSIQRQQMSAEQFAPFGNFVTFIALRDMGTEDARGTNLMEPTKPVMDMAKQMDQFVADGGCK